MSSGAAASRSGAKIRVYATGDAVGLPISTTGLMRIISDVGSDATIHQLSISLGEGETYDCLLASWTTDSHNTFATLASQWA